MKDSLMKFLLILVLSGGALPMSVKGAGAATLLSFQHKAELSQFGRVSVDILESGKASLTISKHAKITEVFDYQTTLSAEEIAALRTLIDSADFYSEPDRDQALRMHSGETELSITQRDRTRTLKFRYRAALEPLTAFLWRLIEQAVAIHSIETDGDVYSAASAINPQLSGCKVLQPDRLRQPLMAYIRTSKNRQKIDWAVEALVSLITPDEYLGFVASEMAKSSNLYSCSEANEAHARALCPLYLSYARDFDRRRDQLSKPQEKMLEDFISALGHWRYEPAIPLLASLFERCQEPSANPLLPPLSEMGPAGLTALLLFLDSPQELKRRHAIIAMIRASRGNPKSGYSRPYPEEVYRDMEGMFERIILPRLDGMAKDDPSAEVRLQSSSALTEIKNQLLK